MDEKEIREGLKVLLRTLTDGKHGETLLNLLHIKLQDSCRMFERTVLGLELDEGTSQIRENLKHFNQPLQNLSTRSLVLQSIADLSREHDSVGFHNVVHGHADVSTTVVCSQQLQQMKKQVDRVVTECHQVESVCGSAMRSPFSVGHLPYPSCVPLANWSSAVMRYCEVVWSKIHEIFPQDFDLSANTFVDPKCAAFQQECNTAVLRTQRLAELTLPYHKVMADNIAKTKVKETVGCLLNRSLSWEALTKTTTADCVVLGTERIEALIHQLSDKKATLQSQMIQKWTQQTILLTLAPQVAIVKRGCEALTGLLPGILMWNSLIGAEYSVCKKFVAALRDLETRGWQQNDVLQHYMSRLHLETSENIKEVVADSRKVFEDHKQLLTDVQVTVSDCRRSGATLQDMIDYGFAEVDAITETVDSVKKSLAMKTHTSLLNDMETVLHRAMLFLGHPSCNGCSLQGDSPELHLKSVDQSTLYLDSLNDSPDKDRSY